MLSLDKKNNKVIFGTAEHYKVSKETARLINQEQMNVYDMVKFLDYHTTKIPNILDMPVYIDDLGLIMRATKLSVECINYEYAFIVE